MNRSKKFLAMFLALAMIFTAIPMNALAAEVDVTDQAETILEEEGEKSTEDVSEGESEELITDSEESETTDVSEEALTEEQQEELLSNDTEDIGTRAQARAGELNTYTKITNGFSNTVKYMIVYTNYSNRSWALCWDGNKYTGIEVSPGSNGTLKVDAELGDKILFRNINNGNITSCFDDRVLKGKSNYDLTSNPGYNYGYLRRIQSYNNSQNIQVDGEYGSSKYLQYDNNRKTWKFNTSNGIISFYAREAKITYNYYVDGEVYSTNSETVPAQENYRISIPNELSSMEFQKMSINGTEYTSKQTLINISGDTVINYYFKAPEKRSLTIEFYQDDKMISGYPKDVEVYSGVAYKVTAPDTVKNMVFSKRVLNGNTTTREDFSVTISKDSKVQFYYINMSNNNKEADEKLYPDDTSGTNDYPNYPEQGSVNISKTASGDDFNGSGVAEVALGVTGVPIKKGVDIVIVFDTSNSMNENISGTRITKLASAKSAAETFVKKVFENNPDGSRSNNRVGLVTFGDFGERIYGLKNANGQSYLVNSINKLKASGGTNYDEAFSQAEFVLSDADEERDKMVVFMTDGAPWKYNGYEAQSYQGYLTNAYKKNVLNYTLKNADSVKAMKNTSVYTIGFGMSQGNSPLQGVVGFEGAECTKILRDNVASPGKHVDAENDTDLQNAFNRIADQVRKSATEAVVSDTLGEDFTLQTSEVTSKTPGAGTYLPTIKLTQYDTYTRNDIGSTMPDGTVITEKEVGMHKGTYTVLETVTFNASGTRATSDIKGSVMDGYGNINAEYFTYNKATSTFTWNIGTITEKEIVLSYYVYLKNSIRENVPDSERPVEGLYDTNKNAVLEYKNYLDHPCKQTFEKPKMPWGTAVVNYQYYLVNESGEPVNPAGEVVPPTFRYHVGDTKQYKIPWNNNIAEGTIYARNDVPDGYELFEESASYTVQAVSSGTGSYQTTGRTTYVYKADAACVNTGVAFAVVYDPKIVEDTVVLDYGKKVNIDVTANDSMIGAQLDSISKVISDTAVLGTESYEHKENSFAANADLTNGTGAVVQLENKKVIQYIPTKMMNSIDTFYYASSIEGNKVVDTISVPTTYYRYQKVKVIPATTVYYEDSFAGENNKDQTAGIVFNGNWETKREGSSTGSTQDNGTVAKDEHPYGYDSSYTEDAKLSGGSAKVLTLSGKDTDTEGVDAVFTFKGTGFDLISRTDTESCTVGIRVKNEKGEVVKKPFVNAVYQSGCLYQIPLIRVSDLEYGTYTVEINVMNIQDTKGTFYLDGIRIYNPLGTNEKDGGEDFTVADKKYNEDKEANAVITEVRNLILSASEIPGENPEDSEAKVDGALFVDVKGETAKVSDYLFEGPNNELYLAAGQSIAFEMSADANPQTIQIGARIADGKNAEITVGSQNYKSKRISLRSGVDMYYDITNYVSLSRGSAKIVITNTSGGIVSITNLKVTYNNTEQPINDVRFSVSPNLVSRALELTEMRLNGGDAEESFTVTFKDGAREEIQTVPSGEAAVAPNWTKEGYTLSWDKAFDHVTSNLIINAVWTAIDMPVKEYTVTFKEDGAVVRTEKVSQGKAATAPVLSKKGYVLSWDKAFTNVTSDLTVNAVWTAGKYTLSFNGNGGKVSGGAKTVIYGSKCGTLPKASRKGYTFEGWYTKASGGSQISADTTFGNDSNTTVYARWKKVKVSRAVVKKVSNVKGRKMAVTVKKASGADGYYIEYSTSKKFTKKTTKRTSVKATSKSTVKKTIGKLKKGKKYYVRVKAYKLDSTGKKVYGKDSKAKTVTVKK